MGGPCPFFDAHLHADGVSDVDLRSMAFFGLEGALVPAGDALIAPPRPPGGSHRPRSAAV